MKKLFFLLSIIPIALSASAQYPGQPTYHDSYANYYFMGGCQYLKQQNEDYYAGTAQIEMLYSFWGTRISLAVSPNYTSFSIFGLLMFAPKVLLESLEGEESIVAAPIMLAAFSAGFLRFPLTDHLEITAGWDALKFTKLRNYADVFYLTGSLNAGLTLFFNDNFFANAYYEFNHTHNSAINFINNIGKDIFPRINTVQPDLLKGHSFGVRIGWMF